MHTFNSAPCSTQNAVHSKSSILRNTLHLQWAGRVHRNCTLSYSVCSESVQCSAPLFTARYFPILLHSCHLPPRLSNVSQPLLTIVFKKVFVPSLKSVFFSKVHFQNLFFSHTPQSCHLLPRLSKVSQPPGWTNWATIMLHFFLICLGASWRIALLIKTRLSVSHSTYLAHIGSDPHKVRGLRPKCT